MSRLDILKEQYHCTQVISSLIEGITYNPNMLNEHEDLQELKTKFSDAADDFLAKDIKEMPEADVFKERKDVALIGKDLLEKMDKRGLIEHPTSSL